MDNAIQGTKMPKLQVGGVEASLSIAATLAHFSSPDVGRAPPRGEKHRSLSGPSWRVPGSRSGGRGLAPAWGGA